MKIVDNRTLDAVAAEGAKSPRLRKNFNIHPDDNSKCHRLLNAIEPDSYIRPHRHLDPEKDEGFIIMRGKLGIITFDDKGDVIETVILSAETGNFAADIPAAVFHTALSLKSGTIFYETKAGPYLPLLDEEVAKFAPSDSDEAAKDYLLTLKKLFE